MRLFSRPEQWQPWFELTARNRWFWGNALNPLDNRTVARRFDGWREFSGKKSFCSAPAIRRCSSPRHWTARAGRC